MSEPSVRILLIVSDSAAADSVRSLLSQAQDPPLEVSGVHSLAAGLELLNERSADLVLLSLPLPGISPPEAVRTLGAGANWPLVALFGPGQGALGREAVQAGAQDALPKDALSAALLTRSIHYARTVFSLQTELRAASLYDEVTGLHSARGFMTLAEQYFRLARRARRSLVLTYVGLDGYEQISATFGIEEGHRALQNVATVLRTHFRESDIMARMGADEFAFVALGATDRNGEALAARLSEGLRSLTAAAPPPYDLALSVGMAWFDPENPAPLEALTAHAEGEMRAHRERKRAA